VKSLLARVRTTLTDNRRVFVYAVAWIAAAAVLATIMWAFAG
jgi:hypothetical protein